MCKIQNDLDVVFGMYRSSRLNERAALPTLHLAIVSLHCKFSHTRQEDTKINTTLLFLSTSCQVK